jgi:hypothetical protein
MTPHRDCVIVDNFVTVEASALNRVQQRARVRPQLIQYQSLCGLQISIEFNKRWNPVRDQGVGGSIPLSPSNIFKHLVRQP